MLPAKSMYSFPLKATDSASCCVKSLFLTK